MSEVWLEGAGTPGGAGSSPVVVLVGDVVDRAGLEETDDPRDVAAWLSDLVAPLRGTIADHGGVVASSAGEALVVATWDGAAASDAVRAARACHTAVEALAATLPVRDPEGAPLRIAWGVAAGAVSVSRRSGGGTVLRGDPVELAFRISSLAGRDGLPPVLIDAGLDLEPALARGEPFDLAGEGRTAPVRVRAVLTEQP